MSAPAQARSAFVPHDIRAPIKSNTNGPLAGLTVAVKDMYDIAGERTGGGSPDWLAAQKPAAKTAPIVQKLLDAGATVIGKTICDEFFFSGSGVNSHYGMPVNPRAPGRIPGGSSAGSASATASGACDIALGSDTGGSIRMPASFCGLYGLRPTMGRMDVEGAMVMAPSFDVPGWFTSGPGVFRKVGAVLLIGKGNDALIQRMLVLDDAFTECDAEIAAVMRQALAAMASELPKPEAARIAPDGFDPWREMFRIIQSREVWQHYGKFVEQYHPKLGPGIRERMAFSSTVTESQADAMRVVHRTVRAHIRSVVQLGTILALPTSPCIAPLPEAAGEDSFRVRVLRLMSISGVSGLPQVTIPIGNVSGCPVGLSFIGWEGGDEALLDLAYRVSRYCGLQG